MIALRSFVGARENARRFGVALPRRLRRRLARACDFALHCTPPRRADPGAVRQRRRRLRRRCSRERSPRDRAAGSRGGRAGRRRHGELPGRRLLRPAQRLGRDARFLIFDCGPLGDGGHGHYDLLSVEAFAGGRPLVVDPGRFTYAEEPPNLRRWFKGTAAHNTVCVDGLDQTPYRAGARRGPVAPGTLPRPRERARLDVLAGEVAQPRLRRRAPAPVRVRRRPLLGGRGPACAASAPHRYDLRFHLAPEAGRGAGRRRATVPRRASRSTILGARAIASSPAGSRRATASAARAGRQRGRRGADARVRDACSRRASAARRRGR